MLYRDHTYQRGALAGVTGSLEWMVSNRDDFFLAFKVVGADPNRDLNGWQSFHVPHAFVGARGALYPADRTVECEDQAAYCGFYGGSKAVAILGILTDDPTNVTVNFNRRTDGLDISLPLAVSPEDHLQHSTCMVQILEQAKAAVQ